MNRHDLQVLARLRLKDARILLKEEQYHGAYYLAGYAIECAIKACIAKRTKRHDFPELEIVKDSYRHEPLHLIRTAGLESELKRESQANVAFANNWKVVKDWNPVVRYETGVTRKMAKDLYSAIASRKNGVLAWLKKRW